MSSTCFQAPMKRLSNFKSIVKTFNNSLSMSSPVLPPGAGRKNNKPLSMQISDNIAAAAAKKPLKNQVIDVVGEKKKENCKGFLANPRPQFKYKSWDEILSKTKYEDMPTKKQQMRSPVLNPYLMPADELSDFSGPQNPVWNSCLEGKPLNLSDAKSDLKMMLGDDSATNSSALPKIVLKIKPLISSSSRCHDDSGRDFIEKKKEIFLTCKSSRNQDDDDAVLNSSPKPKPANADLNSKPKPEPANADLNSCPKPKPTKAKKAVLMPRESPCSHQAPVVRRCLKRKPLNSIRDSGMYFKAKKAILPSKRARNEADDDSALKRRKVTLSSEDKPEESLETASSQTVVSCLSEEADHSVNQYSDYTSINVPADEQKSIKTVALSSNINSSPDDDCNISPIIIDDDDTYIKAEHEVELLSCYEDTILKSVTDPILKELERERMRCKVKRIEDKMRAYKNENYKKRIAARIALDKVVKTIEFNDNNIDYMEELHRLYNIRLFDLNYEPSGFPKPLEWLGLSLKVD